jgi:hypothetical protein
MLFPTSPSTTKKSVSCVRDDNSSIFLSLISYRSRFILRQRQMILSQRYRKLWAKKLSLVWVILIPQYYFAVSWLRLSTFQHIDEYKLLLSLSDVVLFIPRLRFERRQTEWKSSLSNFFAFLLFASSFRAIQTIFDFSIYRPTKKQPELS